jgi:peptidoglycan/LPS O-acetylase OafA/YrhL
MPVVAPAAASIDHAGEGETKGRFYLPQLDGLRFCAFLLVFLHHSPVFPGGSRAAAALSESGWVGVDLFFVLSAYLLVTLLRREYAATGAIDLRKFFVRRVLRIWPLFFAYVGACFLFFVATGGEEPAMVIRRTIGQLLFADNFLTVADRAYSPLPFTQHLWTIAFEEQVYLFLPLLFAAAMWLRRYRAWFAVVAAVVLLSQPLLRSGADYDQLAVWLLPYLHFDTVFAGILLGVGAGAALPRRVPGDILVAIGLFVVGFVMLESHGSARLALLPDSFIDMFTLLAAAFALIVLGCLDDGSMIARLLARPPVVFLGRISYGLYVWHWIGVRVVPGLVQASFPEYTDWNSALLDWFSAVVPAAVVTVAAAAASYVLLERPFLRLKGRFTVVPNRLD